MRQRGAATKGVCTRKHKRASHRLDWRLSAASHGYAAVGAQEQASPDAGHCGGQGAAERSSGHLEPGPSKAAARASRRCRAARSPAETHETAPAPSRNPRPGRGKAPGWTQALGRPGARRGSARDSRALRSRVRTGPAGAQ